LKKGSSAKSAGCNRSGDPTTGDLQPFLTRTRWRLLRSNLRSVRACLFEEDLQRFWSYVSPYWAGVFLDRWCTRVMRSRLEPMKRRRETFR
jgi:hypothetical protein